MNTVDIAVVSLAENHAVERSEEVDNKIRFELSFNQYKNKESMLFQE